MEAGEKVGAARPRLLVLLALGLFVLASRLPFVDAGFGVDGDAWALADASRTIATEGHYSSSRPPGYPVPELIGALFWRGGPAALNGLSAIMCAIAAVMIALLLGRARPMCAVPAALAFAFTPVVYIASTSSMDYLYAIACAFSGFVASTRARPVLAGIALGLAIGSRLPTAVLVLPCCLIAYRGPGGKRAARTLAITAGLLGAACFIPVVARYGLNGLEPSRGAYPAIGDLLEKSTVRVFGRLGTLAVCIAAFLALRSRAPAPTLERAALFSLALVLAVYFWMPYEAGYLIPAVALIAWLLGARLGPRAMWALAGALAISCYVQWSPGPRPGPLLVDHRSRTRRMHRIERVIEAAREVRPAPVVVTGPNHPQLRFLLGGTREGETLFVPVITRHQAQRIAREDRPLLYVPGIEAWYERVVGQSLASLGAEELELDTK